uniref:hypothetical protein n=2 Tax=Flavobacterium sp. TaxID=239 RepID=UPI004048E34B
MEENLYNKINFIFLVSVALGIFFLSNYILTYDEKMYNLYNNILTKRQIDELLDLKVKWQIFTYVIIPLILLIKTALIASVLYIGTFFYSKIKVTFKQLFDAVVKAEFVFLGVGVLKIVWFYFFQTNYTLEDLQYFYPLSALNIVGYQGLESWFIYPLQVLNLFELAYWLLLAYFIGKLAFTEKDKGKPMDLGFKIVATSYGSALLLWVVVVMFFTLNYS